MEKIIAEVAMGKDFGEASLGKDTLFPLENVMF